MTVTKERFNVTLDKEISKKGMEQAKKESRNFSSLVEWSLKQYLEKVNAL